MKKTSLESHFERNPGSLESCRISTFSRLVITDDDATGSNMEVKLQMAEELMGLGLSKEAVSRILGIEALDKRTVESRARLRKKR